MYEHSNKTADQTTTNHDAPTMPRGPISANIGNVFMPDDVAEIFTAAQRPLKSKKKTSAEMPVTPAFVATEAHREKEAAAGDELNPLVAWYSLVAKPIARKLWATMPRAQAAVDTEWQKLREADDGRGTWDETVVREYWDVQREAKEKLARTGVHTHFGSLFDLCVEKASELEEAKRCCKARVVY